MAKLDRLVWAAGLSVHTYGLNVGVRTNRPDVLPLVAERLPRGWEAACSPFVDHLYSFKVGGAGGKPGTREYTLLYGGLTRLARTMVLEEALDALEDDLEYFTARWAKNRVFLHAGVVGWQGRAIVLPGRSFAGKSTLVAELLRAGATYYSDEYCVLDGDGRVHPFPRRLSLRKTTGEWVGKYRPEWFDCPIGHEPIPVGVVAFLQFRRDTPPRIRPLRAGQTVLDLVDYAYCAEREPETALFTLGKAAHQAVGLKGARGEAEDTAAYLLRTLEDGAGGRAVRRAA